MTYKPYFLGTSLSFIEKYIETMLSIEQEQWFMVFHSIDAVVIGGKKKKSFKIPDFLSASFLSVIVAIVYV